MLFLSRILKLLRCIARIVLFLAVLDFVVQKVVEVLWVLLLLFHLLLHGLILFWLWSH